MARIRSVHPDLLLSRRMADLSPALERTFVRLWIYLDDEGRGLDDPRVIKASIYPQHDRQTWQVVDRELTLLQEKGFLIRYIVSDRAYVSCKPDSWSEYQHPQKPHASKYPSPPVDSDDTTVDTPYDTSLGDRREVVVVVDGVVDVDGAPNGIGTSSDPVFEDFEKAWEHYPRRIRRAEALKAYRARRKDGITAEDLLTATLNYQQEKQGTESKFIMLGPTFYGPNERWKDYLTASEKHNPFGAGSFKY